MKTKAVIKSRALIIDPDSESSGLLSGVLAEAGFACSHVASRQEAQSLLDDSNFDLVMVDFDSPDNSGPDLARQLLEAKEGHTVIALAALASFESAVEAMRLGAIDYLVKPFGALDAIDERIRAAKLHIDSVRKERRTMQELTSLATRDPLTGLFNHAYFQERLETEISRCERYEHPLGLLFVDVDNFKTVNDTLGHQAGDEVLTQISEILRGRSRTTDVHFRLREHDIAARYGGDEFVLVLPETPKSGSAITAERLRERVEGLSFNLEGPPVTLSIGIASFPEDGKTRDELILAADTALYTAKECGRNRVISYGPGLVGETGRRNNKNPVDVGLLTALERTIADRTIAFKYQPIVDVKRQVVGYEAFCRPLDPEFKGPLDLIRAAERCGRVGALGGVLREGAMKAADQLPEGCLLFLNLHPQEINDPSLLNPSPEVVKHASQVVLEITRSRDVTDQRRLQRNLEKVRSFGFKIGLDDLREGYLGLESVTLMSPNFLRLSMDLLREVHNKPRESRLIRHYLELARDEQITVVACRIETKEDWHIAVELGCDWLQGYYIGAPQPPFSEPIPAA